MANSSDQVPLMLDIGDRNSHVINVEDVAITAGQARLGHQDADAEQPANAGAFRTPQRWDPVHIIIQIIVLQLLYYTTLALIMLVLGYGVLAEPISAELIFNWQHLHVYSLFVTMLFLLESLIMAVAVWKIVKRSRLCWDYAATLHANHLFATWFFAGHFPWSLSWWALMLVCAAITTVCAEQLCMHTEMKAIPVRQGRRIEV